MKGSSSAALSPRFLRLLRSAEYWLHGSRDLNAKTLDFVFSIESFGSVLFLPGPYLTLTLNFALILILTSEL
jgi:hypothetical protein